MNIAASIPFQFSFSMIENPSFKQHLIKQEVEIKSELVKAREKLSGILSILKNEEFRTPLGQLYQTAMISQA